MIDFFGTNESQEQEISILPDGARCSFSDLFISESEDSDYCDNTVCFYNAKLRFAAPGLVRLAWDTITIDLDDMTLTVEALSMSHIFNIDCGYIDGKWILRLVPAISGSENEPLDILSEEDDLDEDEDEDDYYDNDDDDTEVTFNDYLEEPESPVPFVEDPLQPGEHDDYLEQLPIPGDIVSFSEA